MKKSSTTVEAWETLHEDELLKRMTEVLSANPEVLEKLAAEVLEANISYDGDGFYNVPIGIVPPSTKENN